MDDDIFYASDDRSSIDLIERDFEASSSRSLARRADQSLWSLLTFDYVVSGIVIVVVALCLLKLLWPV